MYSLTYGPLVASPFEICDPTEPNFCPFLGSVMCYLYSTCTKVWLHLEPLPPLPCPSHFFAIGFFHPWFTNQIRCQSSWEALLHMNGLVPSSRLPPILPRASHGPLFLHQLVNLCGWGCVCPIHHRTSAPEQNNELTCVQYFTSACSTFFLTLKIGLEFRVAQETVIIPTSQVGKLWIRVYKEQVWVHSSLRGGTRTIMWSSGIYSGGWHPPLGKERERERRYVQLSHDHFTWCENTELLRL